MPKSVTSLPRESDPSPHGSRHHPRPSRMALAWMAQQPPQRSPCPCSHFPHGSQDLRRIPSLHPRSRLTRAQSQSPDQLCPVTSLTCCHSSLPTVPGAPQAPPTQGLHHSCPLPGTSASRSLQGPPLSSSPVVSQCPSARRPFFDPWAQNSTLLNLAPRSGWRSTVCHCISFSPSAPPEQKLFSRLFWD